MSPLPMHDPRARVVCDEADGDIVSVLRAKTNDVAYDRIVLVIDITSSTPDDMEVVPHQTVQVSLQYESLILYIKLTTCK